MKKIIFLPILMTMALAGCGEDAPESTAKWSHEIKSEMNNYIGEVLPYVSFGDGFYHIWADSIYSIGDKGSSSVLKGYGDLLTAQGWDKYIIKEDDIVYKKHNSVGYLTIRADFSSAGNDISVTVKDHEDPEPTGEEWPDEVKTEMLTYVGEVLPYAPFNEATLHHELYYEYTEETDGFNGYNWYITDNSETNVLEGYGEKLVKAGFIEGVDEDDYVCYQKTTSKGELIVYFDWYSEETDPDTGEVTPAGNQIDCYYYLSDGGVDPTPTSGSVEIDMKKVTGIPSGSDFGSKTFAPGVTISTAVGGNTSKIAPKYYESSSGECDLRCYAKNTLTINATGITKIEFTYSKKENNQFTPSVGTISSDLQTWTGDANSVTFTLGATGQLRISKIVVYGEFAGGGDIPSEDVKSVSSIAEDIAEALEIESSKIQYQDGAALLGVAFYDVTSLEDACEAGCSVLDTITYLTFDDNSGIAPDTWQDGSEGYFAYYLDEDYESSGLVVEVGTFLDDGDYVTQFCVYVEEAE